MQTKLGCLACRCSHNLPRMNDSLDFSAIQPFHSFFSCFFSVLSLTEGSGGSLLLPCVHATAHPCALANARCWLGRLTCSCPAEIFGTKRKIYPATLKSVHSDLPCIRTCIGLKELWDTPGCSMFLINTTSESVSAASSIKLCKNRRPCDHGHVTMTPSRRRTVGGGGCWSVEAFQLVNETGSHGKSCSVGVGVCA